MPDEQDTRRRDLCRPSESGVALPGVRARLSQHGGETERGDP